MDADTFVISTEKKLKNNWTSWTIANTLSTGNIDEIKYNFDKFDKKIKVLIALVNIESSQKTHAAASIKRLLKHASEDKDEWVSVVAGLVHGKLFLTDDPLIQQKLHTTLATTTKKVVDYLIQNECDESILGLFQPLENDYFLSTTCPPNTHCNYVGKVPNFMQSVNKDTSNTTGSISTSDRYIPPPSLIPSVPKRPVVAPERSRHDIPSSRHLSTPSLGLNKERKTKAVSIEQITKMKQEQSGREKAEKAAIASRKSKKASDSDSIKNEGAAIEQDEQQNAKRQKQDPKDDDDESLSKADL